MEYIMNMFPSENTSLSASALTLCHTAATMFFLPTVYMLLFLFALPGNVVSLWVFFRNTSTVSPTHIYLSHLSISNLLLSLTTPFLAAYYAHGSVWTLTGFLCQLVLHGITPVLHINMYIGLIILTWVAISRFAVLIQHNHESRPSIITTLLPHSFFSYVRRTSCATMVCATVWVVAVGAIVPVTVYYSVNEAASEGEVEEAENASSLRVCYSPAVELGGKLTAMLTAPAITLFFVFYLMVLMSYMSVLRHIGRSRRNSHITASQSLLGRVLRNIVLIQVVLSVCLLPYHIFRSIFITLTHNQHPPPFSSGPNHCHPLSNLVELKNCLLFLAALRAATDPLMYYLLDKTFRHQTLRLLRCN